MNFAVSIITSALAMSACQTKLPSEPPALAQEKVESKITPSKIYGTWQLEYLHGLTNAFEAEEKLHADKEEILVWNTDISPVISYRLLNENETLFSTFGCNSTATFYNGVIQTSLDDISRNDKSVAPTLRACFSNVQTASGEIKQSGRASVEVAADVFKFNQPNFASFRLNDEDNTLIFEDVLGTELARFSRWEGAE